MIEADSTPKRHRPEKQNPISIPGKWHTPTLYEWTHTGFGSSDLTDREVELVAKVLRVKKVNVTRTAKIKELMKYKTCAEIVVALRHEPKCGESTIRHTHAALSQAEAERIASGNAKK